MVPVGYWWAITNTAPTPPGRAVEAGGVGAIVVDVEEAHGQSGPGGQVAAGRHAQVLHADGRGAGRGRWLRGAEALHEPLQITGRSGSARGRGPGGRPRPPARRPGPGVAVAEGAVERSVAAARPPTTPEEADTSGLPGRRLWVDPSASATVRRAARSRRPRRSRPRPCPSPAGRSASPRPPAARRPVTVPRRRPDRGPGRVEGGGTGAESAVLDRRSARWRPGGRCRPSRSRCTSRPCEVVHSIPSKWTLSVSHFRRTVVSMTSTTLTTIEPRVAVGRAAPALPGHRRLRPQHRPRPPPAGGPHPGLAAQRLCVLLDQHVGDAIAAGEGARRPATLAAWQSISSPPMLPRAGPDRAGHPDRRRGRDRGRSGSRRPSASTTPSGPAALAVIAINAWNRIAVATHMVPEQ